MKFFFKYELDPCVDFSCLLIFLNHNLMEKTKIFIKKSKLSSLDIDNRKIKNKKRQKWYFLNLLNYKFNINQYSLFEVFIKIR